MRYVDYTLRLLTIDNAKPREKAYALAVGGCCCWRTARRTPPWPPTATWNGRRIARVRCSTRPIASRCWPPVRTCCLCARLEPARAEVPAVRASSAGPIQFVEQRRRALGAAACCSSFEAHEGVVVGQRHRGQFVHQLVDADRVGRRESLTPAQPMASPTGLSTRLSISTSVSFVNFEAFWFTTSATRGRDTIRICAASA